MGMMGIQHFQEFFKLKLSLFKSSNHPFMLPVIHYLENKHRVTYRFKKSFKLKFLSKKKIIEDEFFLDVLKNEFRSHKRSKNKKDF